MMATLQSVYRALDLLPAASAPLTIGTVSRSSCLFEPGGEQLHSGDYVRLHSGEYLLIRNILQHQLPSGKSCVWLRGRPLVASDQICLVPGKKLFRLCHSAGKLVPAFEVASQTHFFHHCLHRPDRFFKCCNGAESLEASAHPRIRSDSAVCEVVDVSTCAAHLLSEPCPHGCAVYPKASRVYRCNPDNFHQDWYNRSV